MLSQASFLTATRTGDVLVVTLTGGLDITVRAALAEQVTQIMVPMPRGGLS